MGVHRGLAVAFLSAHRSNSRARCPTAALCASFALVALAIAVGACESKRTYRATGIVEQVDAEFGQVVIAHEAIPGFMDAMTMNFAVPDPALLAALAPGQRIEFLLEVTGRSFRVIQATVVGEAETSEGWARLGERLVRFDPAPDFSLVDQSGEALTLADLAGKTILLDFIFTQCTGPCPILTSAHVSVQRSLPDGLRERVHFVSISLDPANDTPEALAAYASARGAQLANWSFLTGSVDYVEQVIRSYGVGTTRAEDGTIEHLVVSFLIDGEGRILKRYLGSDHNPAEVASDIELVAPG